MVVRKSPSRLLEAPPPATIELMPGDLAVGSYGTQLRTLLGSCVSVILTDPRHTVAAMNHIVHVGRPNAANRENTAYGSVSMRHMFDQLQAVGINARMCEAYVYGGGNMFPHLVQSRHVGAANVAWVLEFLHDEGIRVVEEMTGGTGYRKVSWTVGVHEPMVETMPVETGADHDR